jgi:hypothetical protein
MPNIIIFCCLFAFLFYISSRWHLISKYQRPLVARVALHHLAAVLFQHFRSCEYAQVNNFILSLLISNKDLHKIPKYNNFYSIKKRDLCMVPNFYSDLWLGGGGCLSFCLPKMHKCFFVTVPLLFFVLLFRPPY